MCVSSLRARDTGTSLSRMANTESPGVTLALHDEGWTAVTVSAGLRTDREQADAMHVSRQTVNRVRNKHAAPGPEFIAAAIRTFPTASFEQMFAVVEKAS